MHGKRHHLQTDTVDLGQTAQIVKKRVVKNSVDI